MRYQPRTMQYLQPQYTTRSRCWNCGRFTRAPASVAVRICDHCDIRWHEVLPGANPKAPASLDGALRTLSAKYYLRPGHPYADEFDKFIDHTLVKYPSPA